MSIEKIFLPRNTFKKVKSTNFPDQTERPPNSIDLQAYILSIIGNGGISGTPTQVVYADAVTGAYTDDSHFTRDNTNNFTTNIQSQSGFGGSTYSRVLIQPNDLILQSTTGSTTWAIEIISGALTFAHTVGVSTTTFTWPNTDGSNGDVLTTDGSGNLSFETPSARTPTLINHQIAFGDSSNLMTSDPNVNITISAGPPGGVPLLNVYNSTGSYAGQIRTGTSGIALFNTSGFFAAIKSSTSTASNITFTLPVDYGSSGNILISDGGGGLNWSSVPTPSISSTRVGFGSVSNLLTSSANFIWDDTNKDLFVGDLSNVANGLRLEIKNSIQPSATLYGVYNSISDSAFLVVDPSDGRVSIGDFSGSDNSTTLIVDDPSATYTLNKLGGSGTVLVTSNNTGVLGTTTLPTGGFVSGTYTPTLGGGTTTNVTSSTAKNCNYIRVGNQVTVFGSLGIVTTLAIATILEISLPIASNIGTITDINGTGSASSAIATNAYLEGVIANDTAALKVIALSIGGSGNIYFSFSYTII